MSTFTTILSFPFWFFGIVFIVLGVFANNVHFKGEVVRGQKALLVKAVFFLIGVVIVAIAYALVII